MRILMLSPTFPLPAHAGDKLRILQSLHHLSRHHEISLVSLFEEGELTDARLSNLRQYCYEVHPFRTTYSGKSALLKWLVSPHPYRIVRFWSNEARRFVADKLAKEQFDLIWCHFISTSVYCEAESDSPVLLDTHNDDVMEWSGVVRGSNSLPQRLMAAAEIRKVVRFRRRSASNFDIVLTVSEIDARLAQEWVYVGTKIWVVPNGVDVDYHAFQGPAKSRNVVIFCGSMDVERNVEAVTFFAQKVLPLLAKEVPDVEFRIVGRNPSRSIRRLGDAVDVTVTGTVDDVRPHYAEAKVAVAPFKLGGGTKLKVLEAMAAGVPVVASPTGAQGLDVQSGIHLFIEDKPQAIVNRIVTLLRDDEIGNRMAREARLLVEARYSWDGVFNDFNAKLFDYLDAAGE